MAKPSDDRSRASHRRSKSKNRSTPIPRSKSSKKPKSIAKSVPSRRVQRTEVSIRKLLWLILYHSLKLLLGVFTLLLLAFIVLAGTFLVMNLYISVRDVVVDKAVRTACGFSSTESLWICQTAKSFLHEGDEIHRGPEIDESHMVDRYFAKIADQDHKNLKLQKLASDNAALPLILISEQSTIKDLIFQISAAHTPSKHILLPKINHYNTLVEKAVDGIQDALITTEGLVDNTITTHNWAENWLQHFENKKPSAVTELRNLAARFGFPPGAVAPENAAQNVFCRYTEQMQEHIDKVLTQYQIVHEPFIELRGFLASMAHIIKGSDGEIDDKKLTQASYWKSILKSHKRGIKHFNKMSDTSASFYSHVLDGERVVKLAIQQLLEMRGRVEAVRQQLATAPLKLGGGQKPSLGLMIDAFRAATDNLVASTAALEKGRDNR